MAKTDIASPTVDIPIRQLRPPAEPEAFEHMQFRQGEFWRSIPAYKDVDEKTFLDWLWQSKHSVKSPDELMATIQDLVEPAFFDDVRRGFHLAPMQVRISPYMIASIDWKNPYRAPIRTQFLPLAARL